MWHACRYETLVITILTSMIVCRMSNAKARVKRCSMLILTNAMVFWSRFMRTYASHIYSCKLLSHSTQPCISFYIRLEVVIFQLHFIILLQAYRYQADLGMLPLIILIFNHLPFLCYHSCMILNSGQTNTYFGIMQQKNRSNFDPQTIQPSNLLYQLDHNGILSYLQQSAAGCNPSFTVSEYIYTSSFHKSLNKTHTHCLNNVKTH